MASKKNLLDINGNLIEDLLCVETDSHGLMCPEDKVKLDSTNIAIGYCSTAESVADKVVTISGNTNWKLGIGSIIIIRSSYTNTANNPTLNVNNTGANIVVYESDAITTNNLQYAGIKDVPMIYVYDGSVYRFIGMGRFTHTHNYVDFTSNEKITGEKAFVNGINVGNGFSTSSASGTIKYQDDRLSISCYEGSLSLENDTAYFYKDEEKKEIAPLDHKHAASDITSGTLAVGRGGTGYTSITDTTYTTARYRASSLHTSETTPSTNGTITWVYE